MDEPGAIEPNASAGQRSTKLTANTRDSIGAYVVITPGDPRVLIGDREVILRGQELALLELLVSETGRLVSTENLAKRLAPNREPLGDSTVAAYVHRLRAKLESTGLAIRSMRSFGYTLQFLTDKSWGNHGE
jgi:two-component system response regulator TctD